MVDPQGTVDLTRAFALHTGVPFFRFSPQLDEHVKLDETSDERLVELMFETMSYGFESRDRFRDLGKALNCVKE